MTGHDRRVPLRRLGGLGALGLALLIFALGFHHAVRPPALADLAQARAGALRPRLAPDSEPATPAEDTGQQLARFYRHFAAGQGVQDWLERIYRGAADNGLVLEEGEYRMVPSHLPRLARYQVRLPVRGSYRQVRGFLAQVLRAVPVAALDNVEFERQKVGEATISARVHLSLYLEAAP